MERIFSASSGAWDRLTTVAQPLDFREIAAHPEKIGSTLQIPKYTLNLDGELNRWVLEKWVPPETFGSPEDWKRQTWDAQLLTYMLGPYPAKGEYEFCHCFETEKHSPVEITPHLISLVVSLIKDGVENHSFAERRQAILDDYERADREHQAKIDAVWKQAAEEVALHIAMNPSALDDVPMEHAIARSGRTRPLIGQGKPVPKLRKLN